MSVLKGGMQTSAWWVWTGDLQMGSDQGTGHNVSVSHCWGWETPLEERGVLPELHADTVSPDWNKFSWNCLGVWYPSVVSHKNVIVPIMLRNLI